jgi:hypothetical protein
MKNILIEKILSSIKEEVEYDFFGKNYGVIICLEKKDSVIDIFNSYLNKMFIEECEWIYKNKTDLYSGFLSKQNILDLQFILKIIKQTNEKHLN